MDWPSAKALLEKLAHERKVTVLRSGCERTFLLQVEPKLTLQPVRLRGRWRYWRRNPYEQIQQTWQSGQIVTLWKSSTCSRSKVRLEQLCGNLMRLDVPSGQPAAEIYHYYQTSLQLARLLRVALLAHLGSPGIWAKAIE